MFDGSLQLPNGQQASLTIHTARSYAHLATLCRVGLTFPDGTVIVRDWKIHDIERTNLDVSIREKISEAYDEYAKTPYDFADEQAIDCLADLWPYSDREIRLRGADIPPVLSRLSGQDRSAST